MARIKKGVKVSVESVSYFKDQEAARNYAIKALEAGVLFLEVTEWYEEVEDPEPEKPEPPKPEPKPERKKPGPKPKPEKKRTRVLYPSGLRNFLIDNIDKMKNQELLEAANKEFDLDMDYSRLASYKKYNNIRRSKSTLAGKSKEKDLPTLPPEDNY